MAFYGMRGTGDWVDGQDPESWREGIIYWFPNGDAVLTAIMAKMKTEVLDNPIFHWWTQGLPLQAADMTGKYTDSGLANAYVSGGTAGSFIYCKMTAADLTQFREGHQVTLRYPSDMTVDVIGKIVDRVENGASSYVKVKLLEADDNSTTYDLSDATRILVTGNINAQGAAMPDAISYDPVKWDNYTQIIRTPLEITGTAIETKLRTNPQAYAKLQKETLQDHSLELEKMFWWSVPSASTGDNGKPEYTTMGIIPAIRGGSYYGHGGTGGTVSDYTTDSTYSGQSWLAGGEDWLTEKLEIVFRYGKQMKMAFCGNLAKIAVNQLAQERGDFAWGPSTSIYGIKISEWITPLGSIGLVTHPLFNYESSTRRIMAIIEPESLVYRPIKNRDTKFIGESLGKTNTGWTRRDGIKEEFLTEVGLEYHNPIGWAYLTGFGLPNTV